MTSLGSMHTFDCETLAESYPLLVKLCLVGELVNPRGRPNTELRPFVLRTTRPSKMLNSGLSYKFADAEAMAYLAGWNDVAWLKRFNPTVGQFSDDQLTFHGAYGKRLAPQWKHALSRLRTDSASRQVVLNIWQDADLHHFSKDLPCNTQLHLKIRQDALHLTVIVRSQDVIWGLPYDHHAWWVVCIQLAHLLSISPGSVTHFIDSLHCYTPEANYYDRGRVEKARLAVPHPFGNLWPLEVSSLCQLNEALLEARQVIEGRQLIPADNVRLLVERLS